MRHIVRAILLTALGVVPGFAQSQSVRVTVPKANVRAEASEKAPILQQVTPKDQIEWRATEGDWFKVLLPPNPALGGARVEAYISKKVSKLETSKTVAPVSTDAAPKTAADPASPAPPAIDTHAANVFLGAIADGTLLHAAAVQIVPNKNRESWTIQDGGDWTVAPARKPSFVVSIGDRAGFSADGIVPSLVKLSAVANAASSYEVGSTKGGKGWKADEVGVELVETAVSVWAVKVPRDLKPGVYAIVMTPSSPKDAMPEIAWPFTVK